MIVEFEKANGDLYEIETINNSQSRYYIEEMPFGGYWIWEGDVFERTLVKKTQTLEETRLWIEDKISK